MNIGIPNAMPTPIPIFDSRDKSSLDSFGSEESRAELVGTAVLSGTSVNGFMTDKNHI
jgi:hypothetical protein